MSCGKGDNGDVLADNLPHVPHVYMNMARKWSQKLMGSMEYPTSLSGPATVTRTIQIHVDFIEIL